MQPTSPSISLNGMFGLPFFINFQFVHVGSNESQKAFCNWFVFWIQVHPNFCFYVKYDNNEVVWFINIGIFTIFASHWVTCSNEGIEFPKITFSRSFSQRSIVDMVLFPVFVSSVDKNKPIIYKNVTKKVKFYHRVQPQIRFYSNLCRIGQEYSR